MSDFVKTGDPADTYSAPGTPCATCSCKDYLTCDDWKYITTAGSSYAIQNNNWRTGNGGNEINSLSPSI